MGIVIVLAVVVAGYLSGSISYATLITRGVSGKEIRDLGNKNPGTLNVGINLGKRWGVLVAFLDAVKSFLPMLLARILMDGRDERLVFLAVMAAGIAAIVGHWKPLFHGFRGGQCVGSTIGVFLFIIPLEALIAFLAAGLFGLLVMRRLDPKWVRWVPLSFVVLAPSLTTILNAPVDVPLFAHVSLGGHPWYWMIGIWAVGFLMLRINLPYLKKRVGGLVTGGGSGGGQEGTEQR
jgi:acyl-phosphate glycerol 3-phosphate acyltransferase